MPDFHDSTPTGAPLHADDLALFQRLGISPSTLAAAGVRRVTHAEARDVSGIRYASDHLEGVAFPYHSVATDAVVGWRVRRDHPEVESDGTPIAKYLSSPDGRHFYVGPGASSHLTDVAVSVVLVEAEKSVLAVLDAAGAMGRTLLPIGLGGCWGWKGTIGKQTAPDGTRVDEKGPLPDFDLVTWTDRPATIVLDSNAASNPKVAAARRALKAELERRGALVHVVDLPVERDINGPDDYIGRHGAAAFMALLDAARLVTRQGAKPRGEKPKKPAQGRDVTFEDVEPWPDAVDGAALLDDVAATFRRYLALPAHAAVAIALWTLHAVAFDAWFASPILAITSPAPRCGKTLVLIVLGALVPRRLFAANVTPAVLFRTIEKYHPTLLIDEADTFVKDNDELRGVLNSGHTRTTAVVIRAVGDDHDPRAFSTWCPKAIAMIGKLPTTLHDRAIEIRMRRRLPGERVDRLRQDRIEAECETVRRQMTRWCEDQAAGLAAADPVMPTSLHDRAADCWRPLLAMADAAGGEWPRLARVAAEALAGAEAEDDTATLLLRDIQTVFTEAGDPDAMGSTALAEALAGLEDRPWAEWSHGRKLTAAKLTRLLTRHDVHTAGNIRIGAKVAKGYRRGAFQDAWNRYLPPEIPLHRNKVNEYGAECAKANRYTQEPCSGSETVTTPRATDESSGVAVFSPVDAPEANRAKF